MRAEPLSVLNSLRQQQQQKSANAVGFYAKFMQNLRIVRIEWEYLTSVYVTEKWTNCNWVRIL